MSTGDGMGVGADDAGKGRGPGAAASGVKRWVHLVGVVLFGGTALLVALGSWDPALVDTDEGWLEHLSHAVLVAAGVMWIRVARALRTATDRRRGVSVVAAAYVWLLFMEEIDWGLVYGLPWLSDALVTLLGIPSLHRSTWDNTSPFVDKMNWFAAPVVLWFWLPWAPGGAARRLADRLSPLTPTPWERRWLLLIVVTRMVLDLSWVEDSTNLYQLAVYVLIGLSGWRVHVALRSGG